MKTLVLERRLPGTNFSEYDPNSIVLKINVWKEGFTSLVEDILKPVKITVRRDLPMNVFKEVLALKFGLQ
jgi:hypothetical protein